MLHACCGPCSVAPTRLLAQEGHDITLAFVNPNIAPLAEYDHRFEELKSLAHKRRMPVVEGSRDPRLWGATVAPLGYANGDPRSGKMHARCRMCYRLRLTEAALMARDLGMDALSTTMSVSPYQYTEIIHEELERASDQAGIKPYFIDFRPAYEQAQQEAYDTGMYVQDCCGCRFSIAQAISERASAKRMRRKEKMLARALKRAGVEA